MAEEANSLSVILKVSEASSRDAGKGLARIDPKDIESLGASVGDIVKVHGKRMTVAKVMPAYPADRGKQSIQIDGLTRRNADVGIGEKVTIELSSTRPATRVALIPASGGRAFSQQKDTGYVGKLLNDLPVISGDVVRATLFGSQFQDFVVSDTTPDGIVVIQPGTKILIETQEGKEGKSLEKSRVSYEDIGGLGKAIQRVREMIELPLKYPQLFERLGIEPPKGVLLHGPPGCGKTLLARAVANETDAAFFSVSGPEIIHKFYGESEKNLREIFEQAKQKAPSIIFLDEIDSIAPKRENVVVKS
jgi:transitional endoplasmic reticulum ATPase